MNKYLHGYNSHEQTRLYEQAELYEQKLYQSIDFSHAKHVLEVGSGVGAQSDILLRRYPKLNLTCVEVNSSQISRARDHLSKKSYAAGRYELIKADARDLDFQSREKFDGAFLCFILEHIPQPLQVISEIRRVLKPSAQVVITEGLNNTLFMEPYSPFVLKYWMEFNDLQFEMGGDPFIGGKLGNMLYSLGFEQIQLRPITLLADSRHPELRSELIEAWTDLLLSGFENLVFNKRFKVEDLPELQKELRQVAKDPNAVFHYSFMQATAIVP